MSAIDSTDAYPHSTRQQFERQRAYEWEEQGLIFTTEGRRRGTVGGRPLIHRNVHRAFQETLKVAGLPMQSLYSLRHLCASLLKAMGADIHEIKAVLGHSQISLTSDTYTHLWTEALRPNADRMDRALGG